MAAEIFGIQPTSEKLKLKATGEQRTPSATHTAPIHLAEFLIGYVRKIA